MTTKKIVDLLGGPSVIAGIENDRDIIRALRRGFPVEVVNAIANTMKLDADVFWDAFGLEPEELSNAPLLSKDHSEFLLNIARAFSLAMEVFEDKSKAAQWLVTHSKPLDDIPLYLLDTTVGYEGVVDELSRINFGVLS